MNVQERIKHVFRMAKIKANKKKDIVGVIKGANYPNELIKTYKTGPKVTLLAMSEAGIKNYLLLTTFFVQITKRGKVSLTLF